MFQICDTHLESVNNTNNDDNNTSENLPALIDFILLEFEDSPMYSQETQAKLIVEIENTAQEDQEDILIQINSLHNTIPYEKNHSINSLDSDETFKKYFYISLSQDLASRSYDFNVTVSNENSFAQEIVTLIKAVSTTPSTTTTTTTTTSNQDGFVVNSSSQDFSGFGYDTQAPQSQFSETNAYVIILLLSFILVVCAILYLLFIPDKKHPKPTKTLYQQGPIVVSSTSNNSLSQEKKSSPVVKKSSLVEKKESNKTKKSSKNSSSSSSHKTPVSKSSKTKKVKLT